MRWKELRRQIAECLTSDMDEAAKVVWIYLACEYPGGLGEQRIAADLQLTDVISAIEILCERGRLKRHVGKYKPILWNLPVEDDPIVLDGDDADSATIARLIRYWEKKAGRPVMQQGRQVAYFRTIARFLEEHGIDFPTYLDWAVEKTAFMRDRMAFPTPSLLAGKWLIAEWLTGVGTGSALGDHAGKRYRSTDGLRERLVAAGFARAAKLSDRDIRHIDRVTRDHLMSEGAVEIDSKFAPEIEWLVEQAC